LARWSLLARVNARTIPSVRQTIHEIGRDHRHPDLDSWIKIGPVHRMNARDFMQLLLVCIIWAAHHVIVSGPGQWLLRPQNRIAVSRGHSGIFAPYSIITTADPIRHCEPQVKQSRLRAVLDCFAALAMTAEDHAGFRSIRNREAYGAEAR
jgi:hypothetical protein